MDLGPLRTLALSLNLSAHGVPAVVTRPVPDEAPISTTGIWAPTEPQQDGQPVGTDFRRLDSRRVLALPRSDVPSLPRGTTIVAALHSGGAEKTWIVDGLDRVEADTWRAIVKLAMT